MKTPAWTINQTGDITKVSTFGYASHVVIAKTKSEAQRLFLNRTRLILENTPRLRIRNGAFLLISHDGYRFICESGPLDRAALPLCIGSADTLEKAEHGASFDYYASDEYQKQHSAG